MPNELLLLGEVGVDFTSTDVKTQLAHMDQSEPLDVRIDSPGGSVFQGFSIHESLKNYAGPVKAIIESAAFSISSYIPLAADEVEIAPNVYLMIHNPSMGDDGDDEAHEKTAADFYTNDFLP